MLFGYLFSKKPAGGYNLPLKILGQLNHLVASGDKAQGQLKQHGALLPIRRQPAYLSQLLCQKLVFLQFIGPDGTLFKKCGVRRKLAQDVDGLPAELLAEGDEGFGETDLLEKSQKKRIMREVGFPEGIQIGAAKGQIFRHG